MADYPAAEAPVAEVMGDYGRVVRTEAGGVDPMFAPGGVVGPMVAVRIPNPFYEGPRRG